MSEELTEEQVIDLANESEAESVTYSLGLKRAIANTFQNYTPFYSVTEKVREGETVLDAFRRAEALVEYKMGLKVDQLDEELSG